MLRVGCMREGSKDCELPVLSVQLFRQSDCLQLSVGLEKLADVLFCCLKGHVSDNYFGSSLYLCVSLFVFFLFFASFIVFFSFRQAELKRVAIQYLALQ